MLLEIPCQVRIKSHKEDYLDRPDESEEVKIGTDPNSTGVKWSLEKVGNGVTLMSWKGDLFSGNILSMSTCPGWEYEFCIWMIEKVNGKGVKIRNQFYFNLKRKSDKRDITLTGEENDPYAIWKLEDISGKCQKLRDYFLL